MKWRKHDFRCGRDTGAGEQERMLGGQGRSLGWPKDWVVWKEVQRKEEPPVFQFPICTGIEKTSGINKLICSYANMLMDGVFKADPETKIWGQVVYLGDGENTGRGVEKWEEVNQLIRGATWCQQPLGGYQLIHQENSKKYVKYASHNSLIWKGENCGIYSTSSLESLVEGCIRLVLIT